MGLRCTNHLELFFDSVELGPECLLGPRGRGFKMAMEVLGRVRLAQVGARAVQGFGGMGFCKALPIERCYRDARVHRIFDGTSEIHRSVIARSMGRRGAASYDVMR
jgi:acyl-CoA dehydrogenase